MPWSRARVRSEAGSLKIPQDQLICSEPMRDKKTLRVTDATEANAKFKIHGLQTAVKDTVNAKLLEIINSASLCTNKPHLGIVCHHDFMAPALQLRTNKDNNFDISGTTNYFGNLTSDSNKKRQKTCLL